MQVRVSPCFLAERAGTKTHREETDHVGDTTREGKDAERGGLLGRLGEEGDCSTREARS